MDLFSWASAGPWSAFIGLAALVVVSVWRGWVVPRPTVLREQAVQQEVTEIWQSTAERERQRADAQERDLMALMRELTAALERSRPGTP